MKTLFSKIISGEIPSYKVAEDQNCYAFLDIHPNTKGHVLCVPKVAIDKVFDLPEDTYNQLMSFSRKVALAIGQAIDCKRVGMTVIGLEVPHAHVHLIPLQSMEDATFQKRIQLTVDEMEVTAKAIATYFNSPK
ncbi:HIT family protein [Flavobacteriaceae bacterium]|jgi:histidine triad (HIT) family protein|nr:HIT family protein [Flavobacteriaceae bacterium]|tara:strand:- start:2698 stop:3099 length:402 start_codon:yes stop_codon:yes gene_type:complete